MSHTPREFNELPPSDEGSLTTATLLALACVVTLSTIAFFATKAFSSDHYTVDYYPETEGQPSVLVVRWPSRQSQLTPIKLPKSLGERWKGKQPRQSRLGRDTILPAGEVLEYDESNPPGRFVIQVAGERIVVSPNSDWYRGERPTTDSDG